MPVERAPSVAALPNRKGLPPTPVPHYSALETAGPSPSHRHRVRGLVQLESILHAPPTGRCTRASPPRRSTQDRFLNVFIPQRRETMANSTRMLILTTALLGLVSSAVAQPTTLNDKVVKFCKD